MIALKIADGTHVGGPNATGEQVESVRDSWRRGEGASTDCRLSIQAGFEKVEAQKWGTTAIERAGIE